MILRALCALPALIILALPASPGARAQSACIEPTQPAPIDGATATLAQIQAATAAIKKYIADSDDFQNCLVNEIAAIDVDHEPAKAKALQKQLQPRTNANQARKEQAGDAINAAIKAYKAAHPG